ncbi:hypothetical protein CERZMDRAFT_12045, partial [Cercospora zeae-maydis SCOH1-5]
HKTDKYFHESTFDKHYDGRFADRPLQYDERQEHLSASVQAYLSMMQSIGIETWLMHGTLLGWYWNRKTMPWDSDVDVMISEPSMHYLANYYNMTMHYFKSPGSQKRRGYLLEINPHCWKRDLDEENKIDARWIDTDVGLFVDITVLRRNDTATSLGLRETMMVKDNHHYAYDDIFPLRDSIFEGTPALVPFAYPEILIEEYGDQALSDLYHEFHYFDIGRNAWLPQKLAVATSGYDQNK